MADDEKILPAPEGEECGEDMDESSDFMTLVDEDGVEHLFEVLDAIETESGRYLAMVPHFEDPAQMLENDTELVIMKVFADEEGEYLEIIEDEGEFNAVSAIFTERLGEDYDILYPDDDADEETEEE